jgi:hypothetical protein
LVAFGNFCKTNRLTFILEMTVTEMFRKVAVIPFYLGRWQRTSAKLNNIKVDLANIDHCGTCVYEKVHEIKDHCKIKQNEPDVKKKKSSSKNVG